LPQTRRINLAVAGSVALFSIAVIVAAASLIFQDRSTALTTAERELARVAGSAEASFNRNLLGVDLVLAEVGNLSELAAGSGGLLDEERATVVLRGMATANLTIRHVSLLDSAGGVVASSDASARRMGLALPPGFLERAFAQPVPALVVSAPTVSFARSERVLYLARPVVLARTQRALAVAEVSLTALTDTVARSRGNGSFEVSLERTGGQLLASVPPRDEQPALQLEPLTVDHQQADGHLSQQPGRVSGLPSLVVARPTLYPELLVAASLPLDDALAGWRKTRTFVIFGAAAFIWVILFVGGLTRSYTLRAMRARLEIAQSKATVDQALDSMIGGFLLLDNQSRVVAWNQRFLDMHPWLAGTIRRSMPYRLCLDMTAAAVLPNADLATRDAWVANHSSLHQVAQIEREQELPDGRVVRVSERRTPEGGYVSLFWDVTERKRQQEDLLASRAQLQATIDAIPDLLYEVGLDGSYKSYHSARTERTPVPADFPIGKRIQDLLPPEAANVVLSALAEANTVGVSMGKQFELPGPEGRQWFELSVSRKSDAGDPEPKFIVISRDITASRVAAAEIEHLAFYDPLTGLPNRRLLMDRLKQALATSSRRRREGALLFIDLDNFKTLNDTLGHEMGDRLLLQVAQRLSECVRKSDTVARLGGDEFVVVIEDIGSHTAETAQHASVTSAKILSMLNQPYQLGVHEHVNTVSIGVTLYGWNDTSPDDLVKQADIAMYQAKAAGRSAIRFYDPQMQSAITRRVHLERDMRLAVVRQEFVLYYQKQATHDGRVVGAEALIRWPHATRGLVLPGDFIPIAEETGLVVQIGHWVLETACAQLRRWQDSPATQHLQLSINVSAHQFRQPNFAQLAIDTLRRYGVSPSKLTLELTESAMLDDVRDSVAKINMLSSTGVRFSIDDFGTGHSSLSYLSTLPIAQLKIAQPFVENIGINHSDAVIIHTIIGMAQNLGIEVIAEGVETEAQRSFLEQHGCPLCQGFLFGKPEPIEAFDRSLNELHGAAA